MKNDIITHQISPTAPQAIPSWPAPRVVSSEASAIFFAQRSGGLDGLPDSAGESAAATSVTTELRSRKRGFESRRAHQNHVPSQRACASIAQRFWSHVEKADGCWLWKGGLDRRKRYGHFQVGSRRGKRGPQLAHRIAWQLTMGPIPDGLVVRHVECGNPRCVRPGHLALGTQAQNMADMVRDGHSLVGSANPASKLTAERVRAIYARIVAGEHGTDIASDEGVDEGTIRQIRDGLIWSHVTGVPRRTPVRNRRKKIVPAPANTNGGAR